MGPDPTARRSQIERDLATALAIEPSPDFLARLRMRIAREPQPLDRRVGWMFAAAASCALATVTVVPLTQLNPAPLPRADGTALLSGAASSGGEKPTPELQAVMRSNAEAADGLAISLRDGTYGALLDLAAVYSQNFAYLEAFWTGRRVSGAVRISRKGRQAAEDLAAAALAKNGPAVASAASALVSTCGTCHNLYRVELPDRTYAIKL